MKIDIISDAVCPWCFVGKRRLESALVQRPDIQAEITWHPFQLNPDMPREGRDRQEYLREKFGTDGSYPERIRSAIGEAGRSVGLEFHFDRMSRIPNTLDCHRVIHWAGLAGRQDAVVTSLFRRYFLDGEDLSNGETLVAAATEGGLDAADIRARLASEEDREMVASADEYVRRMGVSGVPTFIFERKYAMSGAQEPAAFLQVFDRITADARGGAAAVGA
ncbi:MAG: DsbA family oxidoreductase [Alphaproteobacteria bacterium]|nr:DsbA family oxidoreductase [Alphaproteobacteria bacterium]